MTNSPTGIIGSSARAGRIAGRIAQSAGGRVIVHGFELAEPGTASRIERAPNLFDLASECEIVIAVYDAHAALIAALTGTPDRPGLVTAMAPGTLLVDLSDGTPEECRKLAAALSPRAVGLIECGLAGEDELDGGTALVFAGGYDEHIARVKPLLSALGRVRRTGPQGSGRTYAALSQAITAAHALALHEAHMIAQSGGFVPDDLAAPPMLEPERGELARHVERARAMARSYGLATPVLDAAAASLAAGAGLKPLSDPASTPAN